MIQFVGIFFWSFFKRLQLQPTAVRLLPTKVSELFARIDIWSVYTTRFVLLEAFAERAAFPLPSFPTASRLKATTLMFP